MGMTIGAEMGNPPARATATDATVPADLRACMVSTTIQRKNLIVHLGRIGGLGIEVN